MWDVIEEDTTGKALYQNVFSFNWFRDFSGQDKEERVADLRDSLRKFKQASIREDSPLTKSMTLGYADVGAGLAFVAQDNMEDEDKLVTVQDIILASETLQHDPHLMRLLSQTLHTIAELQKRVEKLEGTDHQKHLTLEETRKVRKSVVLAEGTY